MRLLVRGMQGRAGRIMRLTNRGEIVLATAATILLLAILGIAGWVEGGMQ